MVILISLQNIFKLSKIHIVSIIIYLFLLVVISYLLYSGKKNLSKAHNIITLNPIRFKEEFRNLQKKILKENFLIKEDYFNQSKIDKLIKTAKEHYNKPKKKWTIFNSFIFPVMLTIWAIIISIDINSTLNFIFSSEFTTISFIILKLMLFAFLTIMALIMSTNSALLYPTKSRMGVFAHPREMD